MVVDADAADAHADRGDDAAGGVRRLAEISTVEDSWSSGGDDEVSLELRFSDSPCAAAVLGDDVRHTGGAARTTFTAANEPDFDQVVTCLTNGVDDEILLVVVRHPSGTSGGSGGYESSYGLGSPDLLGCSITEIHQVVRSLVMTIERGGSSVMADWGWEFWGSCP